MCRWPSLRTQIFTATLLLPAAFLSAGFAGQKASSAPSSQQEKTLPPQAGVLKIEAPSVVVDMIVTDRKGRSVSGMTADDFAVYDNNVLQKVVTFVPPLAAGSPSPPAPQPQALPGSKPAPAREALDLANVHFITLVLDLGDLQPQNIQKACDAAAEYLHKVVAPEDFVAIYWVDQSLHIALPFTHDKQKAVEAIDGVRKKAPGGRLTAGMRISTEQDIQSLESQLYGFGSAAGPGAGHASGLGRGNSAAMERELSTLYRFL